MSTKDMDDPVNVYPLRGEPRHSAGKDTAVVSVIRHLEDLLVRARSGSLRAIAYAMVDSNGDGAFGSAGMYRRDMMAGQLAIGQQWMIQQLFEETGLLATDRVPPPPPA